MQREQLNNSSSVFKLDKPQRENCVEISMKLIVH